MSGKSFIVERLEEQIGWYDRKSLWNQRWFQRLSLAELAIAALVPLIAGVGLHAAVVGALGVGLILIKGLQTLNQYQHNWIVYRATCEALKHEKYLWMAQAGVYTDAQRPEALLAERVEGLISMEHAKWVAGRERAKEDQEKIAALSQARRQGSAD